MVEQTIETTVIWEATKLIMMSLLCSILRPASFYVLM